MATQLVPLPEVERLSTTVIRILAGNPGKFTLQVGLGPRRILIDTGEGLPRWATLLQSVLKEENAVVHEALLTHWHHDHVNGVPDLLKICPQATVYKHQPTEGQTDIQDGQVFKVDGATLKAFHTPGHTEDHMSFIFEEEGAIFTGDNVLGHGTAVFEDLSTYLSSLKKMKDSVSGRAYPGHGAIINDASTKITDYINHRQQRENEVLRVLKFGSVDAKAADTTTPSPERLSRWTPMQLVKVIYKDVPESLHLPASHGVIQVLDKLEAEGKVEHDRVSGGWQLIAQRPTL
ncbi:metallo-beta-lactamase domain protein, putative [Talaromyces stipitatus ATCC 10500]|uniref:Metallo-beta-lactamase domain protein, putative n=1 Tax=Talaromyces stipitatus (strain ATCC 10500 / CBS 375.48 / QM 6759 / NRRL 1006) TaxID=441959 RepID=B8MD05_TALSN|nr:metallo-beta-lactamase domain protein, putative [Talaromyces stipitatus ATCC 10500]EED17531.1 metallo-beta-lactamase domain protein, putative [Talaromyces stipitatus ATCC 10500]